VVLHVAVNLASVLLAGAPAMLALLSLIVHLALVGVTLVLLPDPRQPH
jgi:hypothetical protein